MSLFLTIFSQELRELPTKVHDYSTLKEMLGGRKKTISKKKPATVGEPSESVLRPPFQNHYQRLRAPFPQSFHILLL